jgi:hypothetical protein
LRPWPYTCAYNDTYFPSKVKLWRLLLFTSMILLSLWVIFNCSLDVPESIFHNCCGHDWCYICWSP